MYLPVDFGHQGVDFFYFSASGRRFLGLSARSRFWANFGTLGVDFGSLEFDFEPLGLNFGPLGVDFGHLGAVFWISGSWF